MLFDDAAPIGSLPKHTKLAELHSPDRCSSYSLLEYIQTGPNTVLGILEVKDENGKPLGALVLSARSDDTRKLIAHGVSVFSDAEIRG